MKFVNNGEPVQIRLDDVDGGYKWESVKTGETIDLPEEVGKANGFEKLETTEGKIGEKKVETKQIEESDLKKNAKKQYRKRLQNIKGIGKKTAEDILRIYPEEKELVSAISNNEKLPFRDDVEAKLKKEYGKQS